MFGEVLVGFCGFLFFFALLNVGDIRIFGLGLLFLWCVGVFGRKVREWGLC